ncbi:protein O-glucosyltransferase 2-like isoform X1 [Haliotis rufescens]|uniref:protein O-glucosyltransferase 2-like isoform X1 n=2 Tax=Haliotis rufescens TaxID=6454 RepID=UPI00201F2307|nr:protein O-glucosyltransferase 2-like isoform X1 [Haliotis rufescens]
MVSRKSQPICYTSILIGVAVASAVTKGDGDGKEREVAPDNCLIWGPGLTPRIALPVRYFYIQAVDQFNQNFTESVGSQAFKFDINLSDGSRLRSVRVDVIDRRDGSYIARFRLLKASVENVIITVLYDGRQVAASPYKLMGPIYDEHCDCPQPNLQEWFSTMMCPATYKQLQQDLSIFQDPLDFDKVAKEAVERFSGTFSHYKIIANKIYRKDFFGTRRITGVSFIDEILLSLARKVKLPDVEFIMNLSDWPKEKKDIKDGPIPIVSFCGSDDSRDIVLPTYEMVKSTIYMLERHNTDQFSVQGKTGPVWEEKTNLAFWRGRDSRRERLDLAVMAQKHPDVFNVSLSRMSFFPKDEKYGNISKHVNFFDFFQHKYQITIDGTVAAFRLPLLLASDSVVLKQDSTYYEHFYHALEPYVHYIPFKSDLSNLLEQIQWAKDHDEEAKAIGRRSQDFVLEHLTPRHLYCYHVKVLHELSKLLKNKPKLEEGFALVTSKDPISKTCDCKEFDQAQEQPHTEL